MQIIKKAVCTHGFSSSSTDRLLHSQALLISTQPNPCKLTLLSPTQIIIIVANLFIKATAAPTDPPASSHYTPASAATATIRKWEHESCPSSENAPIKPVRQNHCYSCADDFLSYKIWQPTRVSPFVVCTFSVYGEENCSGEAVAPVNLPAKQSEADCADGVVAHGLTIVGSKSYSFSCEDFSASSGV